MLKTFMTLSKRQSLAYHLGEGRVLKTSLRRVGGRPVQRITLGKGACSRPILNAYLDPIERITLGKGACSRPLDVGNCRAAKAYHLGEGRVLKTC